jgi:hypothetical protein
MGATTMSVFQLQLTKINETNKNFQFFSKKKKKKKKASPRKDFFFLRRTMFSLVVTTVLATPTMGNPTAPTTLYPKCFTAFILNDFIATNTANAPQTTVDDRENFMFSADAGKTRSDWLDDVSFGAGIRVLTTQIVDGVGLRESFVYDFLNGTVHCFSMPIAASAVDAALPAGLAYVGQKACLGAMCDEWRCRGNCALKSRPTQAVSHLSLVTHPTTGFPLEFRFGDAQSNWELTQIFSQASACTPGSLDPDLFTVPAGLQCTHY